MTKRFIHQGPVPSIAVQRLQGILEFTIDYNSEFYTNLQNLPQSSSQAREFQRISSNQ